MMNYSKKQISILRPTGLFLLFMLAVSTSFAQKSASEENIGILSFSEETIDYGTIEQNADGERNFTFTNTGTAPIVISNVKTSCGCTVPEYSKTPVLPGEKGNIKIKYATNRIGMFKKSITVTSNASKHQKTLFIKGEVVKKELKSSTL